MADDIKHVEGKNTFRSQQQEFVATDDGDDEEEKYEEQKSSSSLRLARPRASRLQEALSCPGWIEEDGSFSPTKIVLRVRVDDFVHVIIKVKFYNNRDDIVDYQSC